MAGFTPSRMADDVERTKEYRKRARSRGVCPLCGRPLALLHMISAVELVAGCKAANCTFRCTLHKGERLFRKMLIAYQGDAS